MVPEDYFLVLQGSIEVYCNKTVSESVLISLLDENINILESVGTKLQEYICQIKNVFAFSVFLFLQWTQYLQPYLDVLML